MSKNLSLYVDFLRVRGDHKSKIIIKILPIYYYIPMKFSI